jgi:hypothetical protein
MCTNLGCVIHLGNNIDICGFCEPNSETILIVVIDTWKDAPHEFESQIIENMKYILKKKIRKIGEIEFYTKLNL